MIDFSLQWTDENHNVMPPPAGLTVSPRRWSWHMYGGPYEAQIDVAGAGSALIDLFKRLRYGVEIYNAQAEAVWWGYVHEVECTVDGVSYSATLDDLANRVSVAHTYRDAAGDNVAAVTAVTDDTDSQARYSIKQMRKSVSHMDPADAVTLRDRVLAQLAWPLMTPDFSSKGDDSATLHCRGWWSTLDWKLYANAAGRLENDASGTSNLLGYQISSSKIAFTGDYYMHSTLAELGQLENGTRFTISGTDSNDGVRTVNGAASGAAQSYTATTISFEVTDDIKDSASGFAGVDVDTVIEVSGAATAAHNTDHFVDGAADNHLETDITYSVSIQSEAAGNSVTIAWGHKVEMSALGNVERLGTATIDAHGTHVTQQFTNDSGSNWTAAKVGLQLQAVNSPTDDITVALHADSAGTIGAQLDTGTIANADIPTTLDWVWCDLNNTQTLTNGTAYWIKVTRGDAANDTDWYRIGITTDNNYTGGHAELSDGSTYYTHLDDADLQFRVHGAVDTVTQALAILDDADQVFAATDAQVTSSIATTQYRDGDNSAREEIEKLLELGTSSGGDILATVSQQRHATIYSAPASTTIGASIGAGGVLLDRYGQPLPAGRCIVGTWLDVPVVVTASDGLQTYTPIFVAECEYDASTGRARPIARDVADPWSTEL